MSRKSECCKLKAPLTHALVGSIEKLFLIKIYFLCV